jgi:molybdate transport system substrate-binding protein
MTLLRFSDFLAAKISAAMACLALISIAHSVGAAEIRVLSGSAVVPAMNVLIPQFEQSTGHRVTSDFDGAIGAMTDRIDEGEAADVISVKAGNRITFRSTLTRQERCR